MLSIHDTFGIANKRSVILYFDHGDRLATPSGLFRTHRGGNAILAVDIDYSELGGLKGMIMVCMTGTAVTLKNVDLFGSDRAMQLEDLKRINQRIQYLEKL